MNTEDNLKLQIPKIFYPAFLKAIQECNSIEKKMHFTKKENITGNQLTIEVATDDPRDFYYLGKIYANYKNQL